jgi:regulator of protease activity HflC (stomatin/prohibitin superfamily)
MMRRMTADTATFAPLAASRQHAASTAPGAVALVAIVVALVAGVVLLTLGSALAAAGAVLVVLALGAACGLVVVQPNDSRVLVFFGRYTGSITQPGFFWVNPFTVIWRHALSLRVRNFQTERIKVNDLSGSPIEIAAVVVWRVVDTARAVFDVDEFEQFVVVQSETAVRHLASRYPYDTGDADGGGPSLLGGTDQVTDELRVELQARLDAAGIEVLETRLTHLAYAREIAEAMLRRQQAAAIVAARRIIVQGAVGLVDQALRDLGEQGTVHLSDERKAAMAANLMLVLTGDRGATPIIDAGA